MNPDEAIDVAAQCRDWLCHYRDEAGPFAGDVCVPADGGKLTDFIVALDVLLGHVANQRTELTELRQAIEASKATFVPAHLTLDLMRVKALTERLIKAEQERDALRVAMQKVSDIRDSIVGMQGFNFSEHAYPLVAVLDAAGFKGKRYEIARANLGTLIEQRDGAQEAMRRAEKERDEARAIAARLAARAARTYSGDGACAECYPHEAIPPHIVGFRCDVHTASDWKEAANG